MDYRNLCLNDKIIILLCLKEVKIKMPKYIWIYIFETTIKENIKDMFIYNLCIHIAKPEQYNFSLNRISLEEVLFNLNMYVFHHIKNYHVKKMHNILPKIIFSKDFLKSLYNDPRYFEELVILLEHDIIEVVYSNIQTEKKIFEYYKKLNKSNHSLSFSKTFIESLCTENTINDLIYIISNFDCKHVNFDKMGIYHFIAMFIRGEGCDKEFYLGDVKLDNCTLFIDTLKLCPFFLADGNYNKIIQIYMERIIRNLIKIDLNKATKFMYKIFNIAAINNIQLCDNIMLYLVNGSSSLEKKQLLNYLFIQN